jgi:hypothetical protein
MPERLLARDQAWRRAGVWQVRRAHRAWAEGQHRLGQDFPNGTIGLSDDEYAAAIKAAGDE